MAFCSQCGSELPADAKTCPSCGATLIQAAPTTPVIDAWDHTAEFEAGDISDNKIYALCAYALGFAGIVIALLVKTESPFLKFHVREATKIALFEVIVALLASLLCWTCIVPVAGIILICISLVLRVIAFIQVCGGTSKEPWLIRSLKFLQ